MSSKPPIASTIESYRRKRQQLNPIILYAAAALLVLIGIAIIIISITGGGGGGFTLFATKTPTPTPTFTPTNTSIPTETPTITLTPTATYTSTPSAPFSYVIQENDSLYGICEKLALGENCLLNIYILNPNIDPINPIIMVGQTITLPYPGMPLFTPTPWPPDARKITYFVLPNDSLGSIANRFNSTVAAIVKANPTLLTTANDTIYPGWKLVVPLNVVTPMPSATPTKTP